MLKSHNLYVKHAGDSSVREELEGGICIEASEGTSCRVQEVKGRLSKWCDRPIHGDHTVIV